MPGATFKYGQDKLNGAGCGPEFGTELLVLFQTRQSDPTGTLVSAQPSAFGSGVQRAGPSSYTGLLPFGEGIHPHRRARVCVPTSNLVIT